MIGTKVKNTWADEPKRLERQLQTNPLNSLRPQEVSGPLEQEFYNMERHFFHLSPSSSVLFLHPHAQISKTMKRNNYHHQNKHRKTTDSSSINILNATLTLFSCIHLVQNVILQCATFNWRTHGLVLLHGAKSMNPARVWLIMTHVSKNSANNPSLGNFWDLLTLIESKSHCRTGTRYRCRASVQKIPRLHLGNQILPS